MLSKTWPPGGTTGNIMMRISASLGRARLAPTHGVMFTGSCGSDHNRPHIREPLHRLAWVLEKLAGPIHPSLGGFALTTTRATSVQAAILSIPVSSVRANIESRNAIFVARVHPPLPAPRLPGLRLPTPIRVNKLCHLLSGYIHSTVAFLHSGFSWGFPLHYEGDHVSFETTNLRSALEHPEVVDAKLKKELDAHRLAGPFHSPPFPVFHVSPIGVVPKKSPGEFRLIHHLSYPQGTSINDGISSENSSVHYATIQDAIRFIKLAGPGCFLAKTDIKNAFRIIPINPRDYHLLGIKWNGQYFYDRCMPMGCASSCKTFETFSTSVEWIAREKLVAPSESLCYKQLNNFLSLCGYLGIPIAPEKTCGPSTILSFAGIELDTVQSQARLPQDKLIKCTQLISQFLHRRKVTLQELQSLIGLLNFACSVVLPGRAFLRRLIDLTTGIKAPHHRIRLAGPAKEDLKVWLSFLSSFNGRSFFLDEIWHSSDKLNLFTDAAGSLGFGAVFEHHWCYGKWPSDWLNKNIAFLEFYPIVLSLYLWGHLIQNRCILFFTDNEALVYIINKQSCRDRYLMFFVRKLVSVCLKYNILFKAKHVPGACNKLADSLSRLQIHTFRQLAPAYMNPCPSEIPLHLQPQHWQL